MITVRPPAGDATPPARTAISGHQTCAGSGTPAREEPARRSHAMAQRQSAGVVAETLDEAFVQDWYRVRTV